MRETNRLAPLWSLADLNNTPTLPQGELVSLDRIEGGTGRLNDEKSSFTAEGRAFETGDVLFGKLRPYLAKYWLADKDGTAQGDIHIYHPSDETEPRFLKYIVGSNEFIRLADAASTGTKMPRVEWSKVAQFRVPSPPLPTQRAIADYLDRETAEIDGMRADLDEMERLLTERRVSVAALHIFGNNDDSPFPRLSLKMVTDKTFAGEWGKDEGEQKVDRPCVRVADFNRKTNMVSSEVPTIRSYTPKNVAEKTLQTGDLLIEKSGGTNINPVGNVIEYVGPNGPLCSNFIQVVRLNDDQHPRYWQQAHLAAYQTGITNLHVHQTTGIQNLDLTGFTGEKYPAPPLAEQRRIAAEIDRETAEIDSMLEDITKLRDLLVERRAAVISAAVTGQIDIPVSLDDKDEPHA